MHRVLHRCITAGRFQLARDLVAETAHPGNKMSTSTFVNLRGRWVPLNLKDDHATGVCCATSPNTCLSTACLQSCQKPLVPYVYHWESWMWILSKWQQLRQLQRLAAYRCTQVNLNYFPIISQPLPKPEIQSQDWTPFLWIVLVRGQTG